MYKIVHSLAPQYLMDMCTEQLGPKAHNLRNSNLNAEIPVARNSLLRNNFAFTGASISNALQNNIKVLPSVTDFKKQIKSLVCIDINCFSYHCGASEQQHNLDLGKICKLRRIL